jgi:hypothetical protein
MAMKAKTSHTIVGSRTLFETFLVYTIRSLSGYQLRPRPMALHEDPDYPNRRHLTVQCDIHLLSTMAVLVIVVDVHRISFG